MFSISNALFIYAFEAPAFCCLHFFVCLQSPMVVTIDETDPERTERIKARMQAAIELRKAKEQSPRRKARAEAAAIVCQKERQQKWEQVKLKKAINSQLQGNTPDQ
jgi:hypothetical protein